MLGCVQSLNVRSSSVHPKANTRQPNEVIVKALKS